jgi:class 3 adenylate cyclase
VTTLVIRLASTATGFERRRVYEGSETEDGTLATFDGPGRAIHWARAVGEASRTLGLQLRAGLHTGEIELRGDDITGLAVVIANRISSLAGPDEVLVSSIVKDLVIGSAVGFAERGEHPLKGVPGMWRLYRAD